MEKIHFIKIGHNKFYLLALFMALIMILFGVFEIIHFENPDINKYLRSAGQLIIAFVFFMMSGFLYKNSVILNKKGMNIRLGFRSLSGTDIKFSKVDKAELQGDELLIVENGVEKRINLSKIRTEDREKLLSIILEHIED